MIKTVSVVNYLGERLDLELTAPEKSGLFVQSITGIGAGTATVNVTNIASNDGGVFNSARAETRNITITLGMYDYWVGDSMWSIEKSRQKTYKYFPKKKPLRLYFETDERYVYIDGYVESNEIEIFSEKELATISIICPDPNFYSDGSETAKVSRVVDHFEFPFSNESFTEDLVEFGRILHDVYQTILTYRGEVENGINLKFHCGGSVTNLKIYNYETGEKIEIDDTKLALIVQNGMQEGDSIYICTIPGNKFAYLMREGTKYNIINSLGFNPNWLKVYYGDNIFAFTSDTGMSSSNLKISCQLAYEGV